MKRKGVRGLTKAGKRRGRPPKYLTPEQIENPAPEAQGKAGSTGCRGVRSDTLFIIKVVLAKHRGPLRFKKELAIRLDADDPMSDHSAEKVDAMAAQIRRRMSGDGTDKMDVNRTRKRRISQET